MHFRRHLCIPGSGEVRASQSFNFVLWSFSCSISRESLTVWATCEHSRNTCSTVSTISFFSCVRHLWHKFELSTPILARWAACLACPDRSRKSDISSRRVVSTRIRSWYSCFGRQNGLVLKKSRLGASASALAEILFLKKYLSCTCARRLHELRKRSLDVKSALLAWFEFRAEAASISAVGLSPISLWPGTQTNPTSDGSTSLWRVFRFVSH